MLHCFSLFRTDIARTLEASTTPLLERALLSLRRDCQKGGCVRLISSPRGIVNARSRTLWSPMTNHPSYAPTAKPRETPLVNASDALSLSVSRAQSRRQSRSASTSIALSLGVNQAWFEARYHWDCLRNPLDSILKSIGFHFEFHWISF